MSVANVGGFGGAQPFTFTTQRIHLNKDHQLFEDGDIYRHMYLQNLSAAETDDQPKLCVSAFGCHIAGCHQAAFRSVEEYEHHYNSLHRHACSACRRAFPSARLLDIHIEEWHDSLFNILSQNQDMYQCLVEGCGLKFRTSKQRKDHLIRIHKYPPDFRFDKAKKEHGNDLKPHRKQRQQHSSSVEVMEGVCEAATSEDMRPADQHHQHHQHQQQQQEQEEEGDTEAMELQATAGPGAVGQQQEATEASSDRQKPRYSYRVPATVCFGQGAVRGFRGRGRRK